MVATTPYGGNTFVPQYEAGKSLMIDYSRNPNKFALNKYCQLVPDAPVVGLWLELGIDTAARVSANGNEFHWPDGQPAPSGLDGVEEFQFKEFRAERFAPAFTLGDIAVDNASWDIIAAHGARKAQLEMTMRTQRVVTAATTSGNYASTHVIDVTALSGNTGNWGASTTQRSDIQRSILEMRDRILDDTLSGVDEDDIMLVIGKKAAKQLRIVQEITDYIKGSPFAMAQVKGELQGTNANAMYGLPAQLFGVHLVVEKTVRVTSKRGGTRTVTDVLPAATPFMCSRPGGLEGHYGAPSFSTHTLFLAEDMTVETKKDTDNRRSVGRVVSNRVHKITAPASGGMFQNCF